MMTFILSLAVSVLLLLAYFRLAEHFEIVDQPSQRGSHTKTVILGGGIIFPVILLLYSLAAMKDFIDGWPHWVLTFSVFLSGFVAFWDDVSALSPSIRLPIYAISAFLILWFNFGGIYPLWLILITLIIYAGMVNAVNFMDGINGLTGVYAFVFFGSLLVINNYFTDSSLSSELLVILLGAIIAFLYFNFRQNAHCFAGDVGSVSLGLVLGYFWIQLLFENFSWVWFLLPALYGVDTVMTIVFRLWRREPIFKAHRHHTYQHLANEWNWGHLPVATLYAILQLVINGIAIVTFLYWPFSSLWVTLAIYIILIIGYFLFKRTTLRYYHIPYYS